MYKKQTKTSQSSLFFTLEDQLNPKHSLFILAHKIRWEVFEDTFKPLYCQDNGRPCNPVRLMTGLLILKHLRNVSDEGIVEQFQENVYYQYFCGMEEISISQPCNPSDLVHFRNRIGEEGIELILKESISVNEEHRDDENKPAFIDSTVQEKNITYPTDAKLAKKIIKKCQELSSDFQLPVRQSYTRVLKGLYRDQRFRNHPKNRKKALKADKKIKTIAGRLVRELERHLCHRPEYLGKLAFYKSVLAQQRSDKKKTYSLHEPEVECISKGKEHEKYEFGNKVSIVRSWDGVILGALSFRNEYDGHTIDGALEQVQRLTGKTLKQVAGDRGYRGQKFSGKTQILIPDSPKQTDTQYQKKKKHKLFCKRAGIEPTIGHLKSDHRLNRNFYKGVKGDAFNVMLAAAALNFKRAMNALLLSFFSILNRIKETWENMTRYFLITLNKLALEGQGQVHHQLLIAN